MVAVAVIALASTQIDLTAQARLGAELDLHWRGAYDILVRPAKGTLGLDATKGLVEPNFVALSGSGGISEGQVDAIRAIPGVALAAPIAWVGMLPTTATDPSIEVTSFPSQPTVYSVQLTLATSDGLGPRLLYKDSFRVLLAGSSRDHQAVAISDLGPAAMGPDAAGVESADIATGHAPPPIQAPVLAVDPQAERELLGAQGAFLDPLARLTGRDSLTAATTAPSLVLPDYNERLDIAILARGDSIERGRPVIPILVSSTLYAPLEISASVTQIGHPLAAIPTGLSPSDVLDAAVLAAGPGTLAVGTSDNSLTGAIRPFRLNTLAVSWPGEGPPDNSVAVQLQAPGTFAAVLTGRPTYAGAVGPSGSGPTSFTVRALGVTSAGGPAPMPGLSGGVQQSTVGLDQTYRTLTAGSVPIAANFVAQGHGDQPFVFAPMATYDLNSLQLPHDPLDYVPYGAYDQPDTTLVAAPGGSSVTHVAMTPTFDPAGLLQVPPAGIVDIHAAELLRGPAPIDAVRVRVAGLADYSATSISKVEQVAAAIDALGLDVTVVAASSPQTVDVYVPAYDTTTSPPTDLGWVEQHWTTLGAAVEVDRGLSATDLAVLALALATAAVVILGTQVLESATRRQEAAVLFAVGWGRARVARWHLAESAVSAVVVAVVGLAGWWLWGHHDALGSIVTLGAAWLLLVSGLAANMVTRPDAARVLSRDASSPRRPPGLRVRSVASFGLRLAASYPARSLAVLMGVAISSATTSVGLVVVFDAAVRAGPTLLAASLAAELRGYQLALVVASGLAAATFTLMALRVERRAREDDFVALAASGWRPRQIRQLELWQRASICVPAAAVGAALAVGIAGPIAGAGTSLGSVALLAAGFALLPVAAALPALGRK